MRLALAIHTIPSCQPEDVTKVQGSIVGNLELDLDQLRLLAKNLSFDILFLNLLFQEKNDNSKILENLVLASEVIGLLVSTLCKLFLIFPPHAPNFEALE